MGRAFTRRLLTATLVGLLAGAGLAPAEAAERTAGPAEQVRAALYHSLMTEIMMTGVETATRNARWSIGATNPYPAIAADKVISACINWDDTTIDQVDWHGYAYFYDRSQAQPEDDAETLAALEERANGYCARYAAMNDCYCQLVDSNGRNALHLPEWFLGTHLPGQARR